MTEATVPGGPIADVSYRNYDGPLRSHPFRWWIIARMMARLALKRKGFWVLACLALLPYLFHAFQLYIRSQVPSRLAEFLGEQPFNLLFYDAYQRSEFWIFLLALLIGAGSIAGDNRTNALQIYLSKPVTKGDYLLGKWMGIFSVLAAVSLVPSVALFLFCWGSFSHQGFMKDYHDLAWQAVVAPLLPAALHASLILGFSAWFKRPLLAGGIYAAFYVGLQVVVAIMAGILWRTGREQDAFTVGYLSVPGVIKGLGQHLY
ncbi:MAG TPA: ABC transporter permease subunit, partial [Armatimonadota bacterium]|nr:ABC transporter permease subunit [Armatimonadota bacterium]